MEIRCHITDSAFADRIVPLLDSLSKLYALDGNMFVGAWSKMPQELRMGITRLAATADRWEGTEHEDTADYCQELVSWYRAEYDRLCLNIKPFTLRNPDDLKQFEEFLDRMITLMNISQGHFVDYLSQCPDAYWDKIDDLRETSYKLKRDSTEYLRCLEKCKLVSFTYSESMELFTNQEDNEYNY